MSDNNYDTYIELSPNYESVLDLGVEERNPNIWQEYIVQDDMRLAIDNVCKTMEWVKDKRRSFWIHGAYGTGKSYAAIVLKHIFEDSIPNIKAFITRPSLKDYASRVIKIREKGDFLVVWKSGATDIKSGTHLMMEMEVEIKKTLKAKFGEKAYNGTSSLMSAAKDAITDQSINWAYIFTDTLYGLSDLYTNFEEFKQAVLDGDADMIEMVKRICDDNHRNMFTGVVDRFEEWIKDIISGNNLQETGIVFIWDEFTGFLRSCGDDYVLQRLSEFCKSVDSDNNSKPNAPFFMCLIVHVDTSWVKDIGSETYNRILNRYHALEFRITESAAYDLIGESIIPRTGMEGQWGETKEELLKSIKGYYAEFDNLDDQNINIGERTRKLCPIHPMTLYYLATVAEMFGASQRTLFRFMKDSTESAEGVGFIDYIKNNGPDGWKWLTADYLWDYFFTRPSDAHNLQLETRKVMQHFQKSADSVSGEDAMHIFKAAMLLIAVMHGSSISDLLSKKSRITGKTASIKNLNKCFLGHLDDKTIKVCLKSLKDIDIISYDDMKGDDAALTLPYTGGGDKFHIELEKIRKKYTRYALFANKGVFSKGIEECIWDKTSPTYGRIYIAACSIEKNSLDARLGEVKQELKKAAYKIGLLIVTVSKAEDYTAFQSKIRDISANEMNNRLVIALLKKPCTEDIIYNWHTATTHKELSAEDGDTDRKSKSEGEANNIVSVWAKSSAESQISPYYMGRYFSDVNGASDLMRHIEKYVLFDVYYAAPERIITSNTAYKTCNCGVVLNGLNKSIGNAQVNSIVNALKAIGAWDLNDLETLKALSGDKSEIITELAAYLHGELSEGAKVFLDNLWAHLQKPPFGYYNSMTAGVFLGLALRCLINNTFNWFDGTNPQLPTPENLATMINHMVTGKNVADNYLSSGSAVWQNFKQYIEKLFELKPQEAVNDNEARKFIKQKLIRLGAPLWTLKYVSAEKFGSNDYMEAAIKITDLLCNFVYKTTEEQEGVMTDALTLFNGRGKLRENMAAILKDENKAVMKDALRRFLFQEAPEFEALCKGLNLTDKDIFDALQGYMQDSVPAWREEQVIEKLTELVREYTIVSILKKEIGANVKTYRSAQAVLNNVFEHMKVSGLVVESLPVSWIPALKLLRRISKTPWASIDNKTEVANILESGAKIAWENLSEPRLLLKTLLDTRGIILSDDEFNEVYNKLRQQTYETTMLAFNAQLKLLLEGMEYSRDAEEAKKLWKAYSKTDAVSKWCNNSGVPILWLFDSGDQEYIRTLKALQDGRVVEKDALKRAITFIKNGSFSVLSNAAFVNNQFFAHIGESYRDVFTTDREHIVKQLKSKISTDVYSWWSKIPEIRKAIDAYLEPRYIVQAKERIKIMPDIELRKTVLILLDKNPELYGLFLS